MRHSEATQTQVVDLFIVGGGINGTGIALDAVGRSLSVILAEQQDLASATSSASSKLIHGGLRYLEHYEFRLVRESLAEREILLHKAPHLIKPLRFQLPHVSHLRPSWMIRIGLFMYDNFSRLNKLAASKSVKFNVDDKNNPLKADITKGYEYSDCWVDDARLVVANAIGAYERGAEILTRTRCISAKRENNYWKIILQCQNTKTTREVHAKGLVNAAGPWAQHFIETHMETKSPRKLRQIKGSHIIVPRLYPGEQAFILQCEDQRIVFVIPFFEKYSVIGTTDCEYTGDISKVSIDENEVQYLLKVVNDHFKSAVKKSDIISTYSGVRPLCDDESTSPSAITRDYTLEIADEDGNLPILNIFGGKLTTYRRLAESALAKLEPYFPDMGASWTANATLPGGEIPNADITAFQREMQQHYPWAPVEMINRLCHQYGARMHRILDGAHSLEDLGVCFGQDLFEREVNYLQQHEWAQTEDDIIWRRTKLKLCLSSKEIETLSRYLTQPPDSMPKAARVNG